MKYTVEYQWPNEVIVIRVVGVDFNQSFPITLSAAEVAEAGDKTVAAYEAAQLEEQARGDKIEALRAQHEATAAKFEGLEVESGSGLNDVVMAQNARQVEMKAKAEADWMTEKSEEKIVVEKPV